MILVPSLVFVLSAMGQATSADSLPIEKPVGEVQISAAELFDLATAAQARGELDSAEQALRSLAENPDPEIRTEARFRLAMLLSDTKKDHGGAAVLLRQILDEKPDPQRVRLELARMQALLGNNSEARRELRAASAGADVVRHPIVGRIVQAYEGPDA